MKYVSGKKRNWFSQLNFYSGKKNLELVISILSKIYPPKDVYTTERQEIDTDPICTMSNFVQKVFGCCKQTNSWCIS